MASDTASDLRPRLERALQLELPAAEVADEVVAALVEAYEESSAEPREADEGLLSLWGGLLILYVANPTDDDAVREVCRGVLRRLSGGAAAAFQRVLRDWLAEQDLLVYHERALRWCEESDISTMDALAQRWEAFCDSLSMKRLQRQRVEKTLAGRIQEARPAKPADKQSSANTTSDPTSFGPPDDPYTITRLVGRGATARVYECTKRGQQFAVKVIPLATMKLQPNFKELLSRLRRETDILSNLRHDRIVTLYATHESDDYMFLVMEIVQGGELFGHIGSVGRLSEEDARRAFLQLVDALTYIHGQRVVHRDLKLENILVYSKPPAGSLEVKVSDFGTAKIIKEGMSTALTMVGTQQYWAPEVALAPSAAGYDFSVDLWSLGVVLYVMLEGLYPFDGEHMADQIRRGDVRFGPQSRTSPEARDLIRQLIRVEHRKRISLSGCLEHAWCRAANGASTARAAVPQASVAPAAAKGGRKGGRNRRGGAT